MHLNEYQKLAQRTSNTKARSDKIENGLLGLFGEGGECADIFKKYMFQGHEFDREHMLKEAGDCMWYVAELVTGLNATLEEVCRMNIDKLKARYPSGFSAERSMNRADDDV